MFPEALMLHYLDDLDSKMEAMRAQFERGGESEGAWTGYNPSLGRPLLNTAKFLAAKTSEEEEEQLASDCLASVSGENRRSGCHTYPGGLEPSEWSPRKKRAATP